ncbi:unnamed protein product [Arctogadus glacialis]
MLRQPKHQSSEAEQRCRSETEARGASLGARPGRCGMMWCQGPGAGGWLGIMDGGRLQQLLQGRGRGRGHYLRSYLRA